MAKIIFTSRYIRNASKVGNLVKYMGTREGVEKLPYGIDHSPATKKQQDLIASIVKKYPTATDYPEYIEYLQKKEKASATEYAGVNWTVRPARMKSLTAENEHLDRWKWTPRPH